MSELTPEDALKAMDIELVKQFGEAVDSGADIVNATREQIHALLDIRERHLQEAGRIMEIAKGLAISAHISAELIADRIAAEWGLGVDDTSYQDEDDEDEDED